MLLPTVALVLAATGPAAATTTSAPATQRVSLSSTQRQAEGASFAHEMSASGRFVVFDSSAENLVTGDTNRRSDIFIRDRVTNTIQRVNIDSAERQVGDDSRSPDVSEDGRYVAFTSDSARLVPGDTNRSADVFVRDRKNGTTERVSLTSGERQQHGHSFDPALSADGRYVAFVSIAPLVAPDNSAGYDVFVRDRTAGTTERISVDTRGLPLDESSDSAAISANGRFVAFDSLADNLTSAADTNNTSDVFVRDRQLRRTELVSVDSAEGIGNGASARPDVSPDGQYVAYHSAASNLVAGDSNEAYDVFVRDRAGGTTERVSVDSNERQAAGGGGYGAEPVSLSTDGRYVAFDSRSSDLVTRDTNDAPDVFVRDRTGGTTQRVSVASSGAQGADLWQSTDPTISGDGREVAFDSDQPTLVARDTNSLSDVFVRTLGTRP